MIATVTMKNGRTDVISGLDVKVVSNKYTVSVLWAEKPWYAEGLYVDRKKSYDADMVESVVVS